MVGSTASDSSVVDGKIWDDNECEFDDRGETVLETGVCSIENSFFFPCWAYEHSVKKGK